MKTRIGFVSNSSSSSFILIVPTAIVEEVQEGMTIYAKGYVNHVRNDKDFMGQRVSVFSGTMGECSSWDDFNPDKFPGTDEQKEEDGWELWENFKETVIQKSGNNFIYDSQEF